MCDFPKNNTLRGLKDACVGTAETEGSFLEDIFVSNKEINDEILTLPSGAPKLLIGNKGSGKSIILKKLENDCKKRKINVLFLTPRDFIENDPESETPAVLQAFYLKNLINKMFTYIGLLEDNNNSIYQRIAQNEAEKSGDIPEKGIKSIIPTVTGIGVGGVSIALKGSENNNGKSTEYKINVINHFLSEKLFYLLIDEPDDIVVEGKGVEKIWALIIACREICQKIFGIRCVVSLRSEIWNILKQNASAKKNIDHFEQLIIDLHPSKSNLKEIILKRLKYVLPNEIKNSPYSFFFNGCATQLPPPAKDGEKSSWDDYLVKQSRDRPRDSIQLIARLANSAITHKRNTITEEDVRLCAKDFSQSRVDALCAEYRNDFPDLLYFINDYTECLFEERFENVLRYITKFIREKPRSVRGKRINGNTPEGEYILWKIIHEIGFINPCVTDSSQSRGFRHINFYDDPNFVSISNKKNMQYATWDVHPVFRSYLFSRTDPEIHKNTVAKKKERKKDVNYF